MSFTEQQLGALRAKLDPAHVAQRQQSGRSLSYIEAWFAIAEANRIFGFAAWDRETLETRLVAERERKVGQGDGWGVSYIAKVKVRVVTPEGHVIERTGTGAGHGIDRDLGLAHESAIKEAESDAMKRALMTFGNPFGLALYDKTQANVGTDSPANEQAAAFPEEEVKAYKDWAAGIASSLDTMDAEALVKLQRSARFNKAMEVFEAHAPTYGERLRSRVADRADTLRALEGGLSNMGRTADGRAA